MSNMTLINTRQRTAQISKRRVERQPCLCVVTKLRFYRGRQLDRATNERLILRNEASRYGSKADAGLFVAALGVLRRGRNFLPAFET